MSLVPDYDESDSDSDSSESEGSPTNIQASTTKEISTPKTAASAASKLPVPSVFMDMKSTVDDQKSDLPVTSVFSNPFVEAENAKKTILEKHVKMVNTDRATMINGKKICWNYRKGRCRFGHNCKYAHDSDIQKTKEQLEQEVQAQSNVIIESPEFPKHTTGSVGNLKEQESSMEGMIEAKKRKRPGLSQGLIPSKKVMKQYQKNKTL